MKDTVSGKSKVVVGNNDSLMIRKPMEHPVTGQSTTFPDYHSFTKVKPSEVEHAFQKADIIDSKVNDLDSLIKIAELNNKTDKAKLEAIKAQRMELDRILLALDQRLASLQNQTGIETKTEEKKE